MARFEVPDLPKAVPQCKRSGFCPWLGRRLLKLWGWRVTGDFPAEPKMVLAAAPHTSNWDFVIAMVGIMATGLKVSYLMKKEAFIWPLSKVFVWLGGVPLDRRSPQNTVEQLTEQYCKSDKLWVAFTPEGTRKQVDAYRTGFVRVARQAGVPLLLVAWDYPNKCLILDRIWPLSGDPAVDAEAVRQYMRTRYRGRHPDKQ